MVDTFEEVDSVDDDDSAELAAAALSFSSVPRPIEQSNVSKYLSTSGPHLEIPLRLLSDDALLLLLLLLVGGFHGSME